MAEKRTRQKAHRDRHHGKAPSTRAGEFIREEMHHIRRGKHGAASTKQAIAIGLSKARRAGVKLPPPRRGQPAAVRKKAQHDLRAARTRGGRPKYPKRSRARTRVLKREGRSAASSRNLSRQARSSAHKRGARARRAAAQKAVRTKGARMLREEARKAARTRPRRL